MIQGVLVKFGVEERELEHARVFELSFTEALHAPFELRVVLASTDGFVSLDSLGGQPVAVTLGDEPIVRVVSGVVRGVELRSLEVGGEAIYAITVVHPTWLLARRRNHRIFQHMSVADIALLVLSEHGVEAEVRVAPAPAHPIREYTTQYGESDLTFVLRICADDGICLVADHATGRALLVDDTAHGTDEVAEELPFVPPGGAIADRRADARVLAASILQAIHSTAAVVEDYDPLKPTYLLTSASYAPTVAAGEGKLEHYEFEVGNFEDDGGGTARATQVLEELRAGVRTIKCRTGCALGAGLRFRVGGHPRDELGQPLLVVRTHWRMRLDEEHYVHDCIPAATPYRPTRIDKPRIHGTQTAFVVGDPGVEQINVDEHGRIELYFRWCGCPPSLGSARGASPSCPSQIRPRGRGGRAGEWRTRLRAPAAGGWEGRVHGGRARRPCGRASRPCAWEPCGGRP